MFILGHVGIALGAGILVDRLLVKEKTPAAGTANSLKITGKLPKYNFSVSQGLDLRFLMLGSMLPDIVDKPLGIFIFGNQLSNGRIFSHTLLFLFLLVLAGLWLIKYRRNGWMIAIAAGVFVHLLLDEMWNDPVTLFWPALGFEFAKMNVRDWISEMIAALTRDPKVYISEAAGLVIILCFLAILVIRDRVMDFILAGSYSPRTKRQ